MGTTRFRLGDSVALSPCAVTSCDGCLDVPGVPQGADPERLHTAGGAVGRHDGSRTEKTVEARQKGRRDLTG